MVFRKNKFRFSQINFLQLGFVSFFIFLLYIPGLDIKYGLFPRTEIYGLDNTGHFPPINKEDWMNGKLQARAERFALKRHRLWAWAVRANNELTLRVFNQLTTDYGISVQAANDNYFMQSMYYNFFNRYEAPPENEIKESIRHLKHLQKKLKERGVPVVGLISPNIFALYPELFPNRYRNPDLENKNYPIYPTEYEQAQKYIKKYKPKIVDAFQLLKTKQKDFPFRFFEESGSHWNEVGACLATQELLNEFNKTWKYNLENLNCENYEIKTPPHSDELDLLKVANLLFPERYFGSAPYVKQATAQKKLDRPLKILLVGTSFTFAIQKQLIKNNISEIAPVFFYNRQFRFKDHGTFRNIKPGLDLEEYLNYDAIIIESNVSNISRMGYTFMETALKQIKEKERSLNLSETNLKSQ